MDQSTEVPDPSRRLWLTVVGRVRRLAQNPQLLAVLGNWQTGLPQRPGPLTVARLRGAV